MMGTRELWQSGIGSLGSGICDRKQEDVGKRMSVPQKPPIEMLDGLRS